MRMIGMLAVASAVVLSGCGGDDDDVEDLLRAPATLYFHNQLTDFTAPDAASIRVDVITNKASDPLFEVVCYSSELDSGMNLMLAADTDTGDFQVRNADGDMLDVVATGFRNPNGLGIGPGDVITVGDQQGGWVPETRVDVMRRGGFYGCLLYTSPSPRD